MEILNSLSGPLAQRLTSTLLHFLWEGAVLAGLLEIGMYLLGARSIAVRYRLTLAAMMLMAACPVVTFWFVQPEPLAAEVPQRLPVKLTAPRDSRAIGLPIVAGPREPANAISPEAPAVDPVGCVELSRNESVRYARTSAASRNAPVFSSVLHAPYAQLARWQPVLLVGWASGAGLFGLRLLAGGGVAWRMRRGRKPLDPAWTECANRLAVRVGLHRARVFVSTRVRQAVVTGLWRPMVLLPAAWLAEMPLEMLEGVLAHELAHLRRLDLWAILLQRLVETLLFYHPAVWWLSRRLSREREMCCDEMAVAAIGDRLVFTKALQWAVQRPAAGRGPVLGAAWKGSQKMVLERIRRLLGADCPRERFFWWPLGLAAIMFPTILMFSGISAKDVPATNGDNRAAPVNDSALGAPGQLNGPQPKPAALRNISLVLGRVGDDVVLAGDLLCRIDYSIAYRRMPQEKRDEQRAALTKEVTDSIADYAAHVAAGDADPAKGMSESHRMLLYNMVRRSLEVKALYQDYRKEVPKEGQAEIQERVDRYFDDTQVKALMKRENVTTAAELETALRAKGSSLDGERKSFTEQFIAQQWTMQKFKPEGGPEITNQRVEKRQREFLNEFRDPIWTVLDAAMKPAQGSNERDPYSGQSLHVNFVGNTFVSAARLRKIIESGTPQSNLSSGDFDRNKLDEAVNKLTAYYRGFGYFHAVIGREVEVNEKQNVATVTFVINEGPRYLIGNVRFLGNHKLDTARLAGKCKLSAGQYYDQNEQNLDLQKLRDEYGGEGYVFAKIEADNRFLEEPGRLDIVYTIEEGDRYRVGRFNIEIKGEAPHTMITTVLNRLSIKPGDKVDTREVRASERRLKASTLQHLVSTGGFDAKISYALPESDGSTVGDRRQNKYYHYGDGPLPPLPAGERYLDLVVDIVPQPASTSNSAESKVPAEPAPPTVRTGTGAANSYQSTNSADAQPRPLPTGSAQPPRLATGAPAPYDNPVTIPIANYEQVWEGVQDVVAKNFRVERTERLEPIGNTFLSGRIDTFPTPGAIRRYAVVKVIPARNGGFWVEGVQPHFA